MRLADHIRASRGTIIDVGKIATSVDHGIERAERFELRDEVVYACIDLLRSKPSSLLAALPLCQLPYQFMWVEFRGGLVDNDANSPRVNDRDPNYAPVPVKQGVLIEGFPGGQSGVATIAWMHSSKLADFEENDDIPDYAINITPICVYFDFSPQANVRDLILQSHENILKAAGNPVSLRYFMDSWMADIGKANDEHYAQFMKNRKGWDKVWNVPSERQALRQLDNHMLPGVTHHGVGQLTSVLELATRRKLLNDAAKVIQNWVLDISGEGTFVQALIALLNSKNEVIKNEPVDLNKINKHRIRRGRQPFLSYRTTHLVLNKVQRRVYDASKAAGRLGPGEHKCRGHFKIRKTGVYWWNSHIRGDPNRPAHRKEYVVEED